MQRPYSTISSKSEMAVKLKPRAQRTSSEYSEEYYDDWERKTKSKVLLVLSTWLASLKWILAAWFKTCVRSTPYFKLIVYHLTYYAYRSTLYYDDLIESDFFMWICRFSYKIPSFIIRLQLYLLQLSCKARENIDDSEVY